MTTINGAYNVIILQN